MAKKQDLELVVSLLQEVRSDLKQVREEDIPGINTKLAVAETKAKAEAKHAAKFHGMIWGGITLVISMAGLAVAYFK